MLYGEPGIFAVYRDAARRAGSSATADLLVLFYVAIAISDMYHGLSQLVR